MSSATPRTASVQRAGAYGFRLAGLDDARSLVAAVPESWPRLELVVAVPGERQPPCDRVGPERAELRLTGGGWVGVDRQPGRAVFHLPRQPPPEALLHPYLAPVVLISSRWLHRESFHAGAFVAAGGVWAMLGDKEAGKSTTLAWLAAYGLPVVCDDALILDGLTALAGPRSIDLREDSARRLGVGEPLGKVGTRERWRVPLDPIQPELPFRGWVTLEWSEEIAVEPIAGAARLPALVPHRGVFLAPPRPELLVEYAALPHWRLRRPRRSGSLREGVERLLAALTSGL